MAESKQISAARPHWRVDRWLWNQCSTTRALLGLTMIAIAALAVNYAFPQAPTYARLGPVGYQEWLSLIRPRYRTWTPLLDSLGLFRIHDVPWFRALFALLAFLALVGAAGRAQRSIEMLRIRQPDDFYDLPGTLRLTTRLPLDDAVERVRAGFESLFGRARAIASNGQAHIATGHGAWLSAGAALGHIGLVGLTVGFGISGRLAWEQTGVQLAPQHPVRVGPDQELRIELVDQGEDYVRLRAGPDKTIRVARDSTRRVGGYCYQLVQANWPLVRLRANNSAGALLALYDYAVRPKAHESLEFAFTAPSGQEETDRLFIVSGENAVGRLQWVQGPSDQAQPFRFRLWVFAEDGQALIGSQELTVTDDSLAVHIGGVTYTLQVSRFALINIAYVPGLWLSRSSALLLIIGIACALVPWHHTWARLTDRSDGTSIEIRDRTIGRTRRSVERRNQLLSFLSELAEDRSLT